LSSTLAGVFVGRNDKLKHIGHPEVSNSLSSPNLIQDTSNSLHSVTKAPVRLNLGAMSTVAEIIEAVKRLDVEEKRKFLSRLLEVDFDDAWDRQIEADARAGRLDSLWQQALTEIKAGNVKPLDDVLNNT
jgi:hypothetical protein